MMRIRLGELRQLVREMKMRQLSPNERTIKVLPEELKVGDMIVFRAWGDAGVAPWLKQVRNVTDPGYAILVGLNTDRGFERKEFSYDKEVEIVERDNS